MTVKLTVCCLALSAVLSAQGRGTGAPQSASGSLDPAGAANAMRARATPPTGPAPRMANGKPSLEGIWLNAPGPAPAAPTLLPAADKAFKDREAKKAQGPPPLANCLPDSPVLTTQPFAYQVVQGNTMVTMLQDQSFPGWRHVFMDGRGHPKDWNPAFFGHSIGSWDGDTLVIDTVGFNEDTLFVGRTHTEQLHVIERIRRSDAGHLEVDITAEDPGAFASAWKGRFTATLAGKNEEIREALCENSVFPQYLGGK